MSLSWKALQKWQLSDFLHDSAQMSAGNVLWSTMLSDSVRQSPKVMPWQGFLLWAKAAATERRRGANIAIHVVVGEECE